MNIMDIGKNIASLRKQKGTKQEELATFVGVTPQAVSKWENGGVPDTELLPKIADFFGVSIDLLFGRNVTDYTDVKTALMKKIIDTPMEERYKVVFEYCWDMERALFGDDTIIKEIGYSLEALSDSGVRQYSQVITDFGITQMRLNKCLRYFLLVPEPENSTDALLDGIDYVSFFKDFSDKAVWDTCLLLYRREFRKAFTPGMLVKNLGFDYDKASQVLDILDKYNILHINEVEIDDEIHKVYQFIPNPAFVSMLIFAGEMINKPLNFVYNCDNRRKPLLK